MRFSYRFVGFGTRFTLAAGVRAADDTSDPATLYRNEIAVDVGGTCLGYHGETAAVLDHHLWSVDAAPCASAAVVEHAPALRERFADANDGVLWLVAHRDPDFDAFAAMYLVRRLLEDPQAAGLDWKALGIEPGRTDWFAPRLGAGMPPEARWMVLLAAYAAHVDKSRPVPCPRERALHSVLYAGIVRGRPFAASSTGAYAFFTTAQRRIEEGLNPLYDSLFEHDATFASDLALLDRESAAYERDLRRGRKALVLVPVASGDLRAAYRAAAEAPFATLDHPLDDRRELVDGIYLRAPECMLFKEWARSDTHHSSFGRGFTFTFVAFTGRRAHASANSTDYFISLDPDSAGSANLYAVWEALQRAERDVLAPQTGAIARSGFEVRAGADATGFDDPWFDGGVYGAQLIATPNRGSALGPPGRRADCADDPVARIVSAVLENPLYAGESVVRDEPMSTAPDATPSGIDRRYALPRDVEPAGATSYRFAAVPLAAGLDLYGERLSEQIALELWGVLHPAERDARPPHLAAHTIVHGSTVGVWSRHGIAVAYAPEAAEAVRLLAGGFSRITALERNVDRYARDVAGDDARPLTNADERRERLARRVSESEALVLEMADVRRFVALAEGRLLDAFTDAIDLPALLETLRDLTRTREVRLQANAIGGHAKTIADVQEKVEWLELFFVSIYATELADIIARHALGPSLQLLFTILASIVILVCASIFLRPLKSGRMGLFLLVPGALLLAIGLGAGIYNAVHGVDADAGAAAPAPVSSK